MQNSKVVFAMGLNANLGHFHFLCNALKVFLYLVMTDQCLVLIFNDFDYFEL